MEHGYCPHCRGALSIPEGLAEFSCLYCGQRLTMDQLLRELPDGNCAGDYADFQRNALHAAVDFPKSMEHMSKPLFFDYFDAYYAACRAPFEALERCAAATADKEKLAQEAATWLMEQVDAWLRAQKGWDFKPKRSEIRDRTKFTIAIFLVPTAQKCAPIIGERFCEKLRGEWIARYPDSPFELTTYENLAAGFKKTPWCFVTTAVCEFYGQPDDCAMLTAFRSFRDGYLRKQPEGEAEIAEYYDKAPGIVARIDCCEDRAAIYPMLYERYLAPCMEALENNDPAQCHQIYRGMMDALYRSFQMEVFGFHLEMAI